MKLVATALAVLLVSGFALAGGGEVPEGASSSDRPAAARLDEAKCQAVWQLTEREGDVLLAANAKPYIVNLELVDKNKDGKISKAEFTEGCNGGWVLDPEESKKMEPGTSKP